jgi:hypothetical protein
LDGFSVTKLKFSVTKLKRVLSYRVRVETAMYFAAAVLLVLSGVFYAAGHHELGSYSADVCRYGSMFCDNPFYVLVGAGLAAVWGAFVSVR